MATAMVTLTWCDWHLSVKDEEVPAQSFTWDGMTVDLCPECAAPLAAARAVFEEYGSRGKRTPSLASVRRRAKRSQAPQDAPVEAGSVPGDFPCPAPDCEAVLTNRNSLGAHARQMHGVTLGVLEGKPVLHTCPDCGQGFTTGPGFSLHQRKHARSA